MNEKQHREALDKVKAQFAEIAGDQNVWVVIPAAMEIVMGSILSIKDKQDALAAVQSLRPMVEHIEARIRGGH